MDRLERTWRLFVESYAVLTKDVEILLFPVLSGISAILLGIAFFVPLYRTGMLEALRTGHGEWPAYAILFVWYYITFFSGIFFNGALAACANIRLSGGDPTVGDGLRIAFSRIGRIAVWALVAATVGLFLRSLRERGGLLTRILGVSLEIAWALVTYMIVPIILFEDRGIYDSIYRSQDLFKKHWGEQVAGGFGFGLIGMVLTIPAFGLGWLAWGYDPALGIIMGVCYVVILSIVMSAIKGVFTVALYRYATSGEPPSGFSADAIDGALGGRPRRSSGTWTGY